MQLLYSPASPFARKVRIAAHELGLAERLEVAVVNPWTDETVRQVNPLSQVPALIADDGSAVFDSAVICEYLDALAGGGLYPDGEARWGALVLQALADGIGDAAVRAVVEGRRAEGERHADVVERAMKAVEAGLGALADQTFWPDRFAIGEIAVAAQLGYLDFRDVVDWRSGRPGLAAWYEAVARRDSMIATEPVQVA